MTTSLRDLTWPEAEARRAAALLAVPVGATEQHGPHLPLSTDTDLAVALAQRLAAAVDEVIVAPAVAYGASGEHAAFAGTLSIGVEATEQLLVELGRSARASFARLLLLSTHGGNAAPVARAVRRLRDEGSTVMAWSPRLDGLASQGGDAHAGFVETSLMLALEPARVRDYEHVGGNVSPLRELWPALRSGGVAAVSPSGVLGDPANASAEVGRCLLDDAVDDLVSAVRDWIGGPA